MLGSGCETFSLLPPREDLPGGNFFLRLISHGQPSHHDTLREIAPKSHTPDTDFSPCLGRDGPREGKNADSPSKESVWTSQFSRLPLGQPPPPPFPTQSMNPRAIESPESCQWSVDKDYTCSATVIDKSMRVARDTPPPPTTLKADPCVFGGPDSFQGSLDKDYASLATFIGKCKRVALDPPPHNPKHRPPLSRRPRELSRESRQRLY